MLRALTGEEEWNGTPYEVVNSHLVWLSSRCLIVVRNFWAACCQNCGKELPTLKELTASSKAKVAEIALAEDGLN
jgi:hypothetical protein